MSIPVLILFVLFFALLCPAFLYWFSLYLRNPETKRPSIIGFPQDSGGFSQNIDFTESSRFPGNSEFGQHNRFPEDSRTDQAQTLYPPRIDTAQERR